MEDFMNYNNSDSKLGISYNPPSFLGLIGNKIKIFVDSQLVESFSSKDSVSTEIPIQAGRRTIVISAAMRKQRIKCYIDPSKTYSLFIKYNRFSGKFIGTLTDNATITGSEVPSKKFEIQPRSSFRWGYVAMICLIGIAGYWIFDGKQGMGLSSKDSVIVNPVIPASDPDPFVSCVKCYGTGMNQTPIINRNLIGPDVSSICNLCHGDKKIRKSVADMYIGQIGGGGGSITTGGSDEYMDCTVCNGDGDCWSCGGRGQHIRDNPYSLSEKIIGDCDVCHGSGRCPTCNGKKKILKR